jgi:vacuolar-type H+-ATPase subunit B/Vma2
LLEKRRCLEWMADKALDVLNMRVLIPRVPYSRQISSVGRPSMTCAKVFWQESRLNIDRAVLNAARWSCPRSSVNTGIDVLDAFEKLKRQLLKSQEGDGYGCGTLAEVSWQTNVTL